MCFAERMNPLSTVGAVQDRWCEDPSTPLCFAQDDAPLEVRQRRPLVRTVGDAGPYGCDDGGVGKAFMCFAERMNPLSTVGAVQDRWCEDPSASLRMTHFREDFRCGENNCPLSIVNCQLTISGIRTACRRCPPHRRRKCPFPPSAGKDRTCAAAGQSSCGTRSRQN